MTQLWRTIEHSGRSDSWIAAYLRGRTLQMDARMSTHDRKRGRLEDAVRSFEEADRRLASVAGSDAGKPEALLHVFYEEHECLLELGRRDHADALAGRYWKILDASPADGGEFQAVIERARTFARGQVRRPAGGAPRR